MKFDPNKHHRRSVRLKEYDYAQPGWYFITVCTFNREFLFGNIIDHQMILNEYDRIVETEWIKTSKIRNNVFIDDYIIIPNHIHGIIVINNLGAHCNVPLPNADNTGRFEQFGKSSKNSIPTIIKLFKSVVTKNINKIRNTPGLPVWQRNYYEHVIRNEKELNRIRSYIKENPIKWTEDKYYSSAGKQDLRQKDW